MPTSGLRASAATSPAPSRSGFRRRLVCLALLAITIPAGLAWRFGPLHLPPFAYKYGGSMLWAMGVYWLIAAILPNSKPSLVSVVAAVVAVAVELFKLVRIASVDRFRDTFAGKVLIGRYFTLGAIVAYLLAIAITMWLDLRFQPGRQSSPQRRSTRGLRGPSDAAHVTHRGPCWDASGMVARTISAIALRSRNVRSPV